MKRSEMLNLMEQEYNNWLSNPLEKHEIEWILSFLERNGMEPPSIKNPTNPSGWDIGKGVPAYVNEWEKE